MSTSELDAQIAPSLHQQMPPQAPQLQQQQQMQAAPRQLHQVHAQQQAPHHAQVQSLQGQVDVNAPIQLHHHLQQPGLQLSTSQSQQSAPPAPKSVAMPTPSKPISGDEIPPMHAIRVSTKGFRQRWNGQQWRRLCDEPTCLREAQRLSLCAKHQPIKDWRPSRRSGGSTAKKASPKRGQRRSNPVDFQAALGMPGVNPHSMPLADPSLFPVDAGSLPMAVSEHDDQLGAPMHGGWPPMGSIPGYALMPSAYPQQGYPYENPALLHLAAEQMAAAWSMQQAPPSHIPSQFIR